jgi:hypothetical protein
LYDFTYLKTKIKSNFISLLLSICKNQIKFIQMKKLILLLVAIATSALFSINAQTLLYSNDFESGLNGSTIVGNGVIEASGDAAHGQVFHNDPTLTNAVRTNYLLLPTTIFSDFQTSGSQGLTVSFWVNKNNATNYYWSPMFGAYGAAPSGGNGKPALTLMSRATGLVNFDYNNSINGTNYGWSDFIWGDYTSTAWLDAGGWHFYTFTITPTTGIVYIDGVLKNQWTFNNNVNGLFNVASEIKYATLGGNQAWSWNDPDPAFSFDKLKIYAAALNSAQINSLMTTDGLVAPVLTASISALYFDDKFTSESFVVNGANLATDITISAPAGITLGQTTISKSAATDVSVSAVWDGTTSVVGNITLTSGAKTVDIAVKTSTNTCYTPAYATGNMIADPTFSAASLAAGGFGSWGPTAIVYKNAYCGRGTAYVRGSCWPDGGSLNRALNTANGNALMPLTQYRLRAMINSQASPGTYFHFQIEGVNGSDNIFFNLPNTNGWKQIDTTFTTGATVTEHGIYFNSCNAASPAITDTCFIDNYELYAVPSVTTSVNSIDAVQNQHIYVDGNKLVIDMNLSKASSVQFFIYNSQGSCINQTIAKLENEGNITKTLTAPQNRGVYFVKTMVDGKFNVTKIIK